MSSVSLKDAKAAFSSIVDQASAGEFVTITRHGKPAAVLVSVDAAEIARKASLARDHSFAEHLLAFPVTADIEFDRNPAPSRDIDL